LIPAQAGYLKEHRMKKVSLFFAVLFPLLLTSCGNPHPAPPDPGPVEVYAILAEKDDYKDVGMTDLLVDYIDIIRIRETLESLGWPVENISELREFTREDLMAELDRLEEEVDANDLVFFYITAHGRYLSHEIVWHGFFPDEWEEIASTTKVLVVDSCQAAKFTTQLNGEPGLAIAAVDEDEYGWKGLEEEKLPIVGGIFTYYFVEALTDPAADANGNGRISVQEAALAAEKQQRSYMHQEVFAVPEFVEMYHSIGVEPEKDPTFPDVIIGDSLGEELYLHVARGK
jgi:hypothetical protein